MSDDVATRTGVSAASARASLHSRLGKRIRSVRQELGVSQAACARKAGIDVSTLFRIESTGQNLTVETLARLAVSLDVGMDHLVSGVTPDPGIIEPRLRR